MHFTPLAVLILSRSPAWGWQAPGTPLAPGPPGPSSLPATWNPGSGDQERTAKERPQAPAQNHLADGSPVSHLPTLPLGTSWPTRAGSDTHRSAPCTLPHRLVGFQGCTLVGTAVTFQPQVVSHSLPVAFARSALMPPLAYLCPGSPPPCPHTPDHLQPVTSPVPSLPQPLFPAGVSHSPANRSCA